MPCVHDQERQQIGAKPLLISRSLGAAKICLQKQTGDGNDCVAQSAAPAKAI